MTKKNLYEKTVDRLKSNPLISTILFIVLLIVGASEITKKSKEIKKDSEKLIKKYIKVDKLKHNLARAKFANEKWGFLDKDSNVVIQPLYDTASNFFGDDLWAIVKKDNYYGYIDKRGNTTINIEYDTLYSHFWSENVTHSIVGKNGKQGIISKDNDISVPIIYDKIHENLDANYDWKDKTNLKSYTAAVVEKNDKFGIVDINGNVIVPIIYDGFERTLVVFFDEKRNISTNPAIGMLGNKKGLLDYGGDILIPFEYDGISEIKFYYSMDRFTDANGYTYKTAIVRNDDFYGMYEKEKGLVLPLIYDQINELSFETQDTSKTFNDEGALQCNPSNIGLVSVSKNDNWGFVEIGTNKTVIPFKYYSAEYFSCGKAVVQKEYSDCGEIDINDNFEPIDEIICIGK